MKLYWDKIIEKENMNDIEMTPKRLKDNLSERIKELNGKIKNARQGRDKADDESVRIAYEKSIQNYETELKDLQDELDELQQQSKNKVKQKLEEFINNLDKNTHLAYIATDAKYVLIKNYSTTDDRTNLDIRYLAWRPLLGVLNMLVGRPGYFSDVTEDDLRTCFERAGASYLIKTSSFDEPKWDPKDVFNILNIQRKYWAPLDCEGEYNGFFDDLVYSLGGGKAENIEYIERWIGYKYLFPEKCKTTPGLNITGKPGGNGKGMFGLILTSVFTPMGVTTVTSKNFTGGFNSIMEGKVVTILDDEKKDGFPNEELKRASGNGSIIIEPKGVDAYSVDTTNTLVVFDNTGLVRLVGGGSAGEDRRWSIITTELTLLEVIEQRYQCSTIESKEMAEAMGRLFENRLECGRWLRHVIEKHNIRNMGTLLPLHGQDYRDRLNDQKDQYIETFESLLPVIEEQGLIPFKFLKEIMEVRLGRKISKTNDLSSRFDEFLSRKGHKNVDKGEANISITWQGQFTSDRIKGRVRRIDLTKNTFDYSRISSSTYDKRAVIGADTLAIHEYSEDSAEEAADFKNSKSDSAESLTPLQMKKPNEINDLQAGQVAESKKLDSARVAADSASQTTMAPILRKMFDQLAKGDKL